jgi:hypothetical protein
MSFYNIVYKERDVIVRDDVNHPMGKPRGLRVARNDKAPASGRLTAARQRRSPAACASSDAGRPTCSWQRFLPGTRRMFGWSRCAVQTVRSAKAECLSTQTACHNRRVRGAALAPSPPPTGEGSQCPELDARLLARRHSARPAAPRPVGEGVGSEVRHAAVRLTLPLLTCETTLAGKLVGAGDIHPFIIFDAEHRVDFGQHLLAFALPAAE